MQLIIRWKEDFFSLTKELCDLSPCVVGMEWDWQAKGRFSR